MRYTLIALSALALSTGAVAAEKDFVVEHADLDLSNPKAKKTLAKRIDSAAKAYCGRGKITTGTRIDQTGANACYHDVRKLAREQMAVLIARETERKGG